MEEWGLPEQFSPFSTFDAIITSLTSEARECFDLNARFFLFADKVENDILIVNFFSMFYRQSFLDFSSNNVNILGC